MELFPFFVALCSIKPIPIFALTIGAGVQQISLKTGKYSHFWCKFSGLWCKHVHLFLTLRGGGERGDPTRDWARIKGGDSEEKAK